MEQGFSAQAPYANKTLLNLNINALSCLTDMGLDLRRDFRLRALEAPILRYLIRGQKPHLDTGITLSDSWRNIGRRGQGKDFVEDEAV